MKPLSASPELAAGEPLLEDSRAEFHLADYIDVLRRRWRLAAVFCAVCGIGGLVHYFVTPRMYQATTTIQIDRRTLSLSTGGDTPWVENWYNLEFYPTQYNLLQSRGLAERVVTDLRLYEDPAFNPAWASWRTSGKRRGGTPDLDAAQLGGLGMRVLGGLEIAPIKNTQLVAINYRSSSPELAARIANGVADSFIDWGIEDRTTSAGKASSFLGKQIESLKQQIEDKEKSLQAYSRRSDIVSIDPATNPTLQQLQALNKDYMAAVSARIEKEAAYNQAINAPPETTADSISGGLVSQQRHDLLVMEQEYNSKRSLYKPDMPAMVELLNKIADAKKHMQGLIDETVAQGRRSARTEFETAKRQEAALQAELNRAREETMRMGSAAVQYNNLSMEVDTQRQQLDSFLKRQSETEVTARLQATRESNVRVVDRALVPGTPFAPSMRRDLGMALGLGLFLGIGCIFLLEYLDRSVKTAEEAERVLGLPVLAVIPDVLDRGAPNYRYAYGHGGRRKGKLPRRSKPKGKDKRTPEELKEIELLPQTKPRHAVSEAYRSLRTALLLSSAQQLRVIALTSANSGEGKTATAANLAVVMAQLGRQVLLIDADLRKPRLHKVFNLSNREGLVHCLTGGDPLEKLIQPTGVNGLFILPSGTIPPNPSELLASERMRELLEVAQRRFDLVIVDTPPLLAVTDASVIGAMVDGVVFCLYAGRVQRGEAVASCDRLRVSGARVLGTVLNRYLAGKGNDGKHYYYYYQYQTYGESDERTSGSSSSAA
ncbi:MAG TPA: polysaccharide biosynthesis tyrosine autokinase [Thermoanaerobaculia bacterium]|nr:polysaccharide biosynthesis tyrosine autokinase [Thermoanaerobaculia bacterium]